MRPTLFPLSVLLAPMLTACAIQDSHVSHRAQRELVGMSALDLEACMGAPDQHASFGNTDILTYASSSASSGSFSLPIVGGPSFSNGGNCHAIVRVVDGKVAAIRYSGEKNATGAPDAYCAPIVRSCVQDPDPGTRAKPAP